MDIKVNKTELQRVKFPEIMTYNDEEKETSRAGKMKMRYRSSERHHSMHSYPGYNLVAAKKLRIAASDGSYEEVLSLVMRGADVKKADLKGRTPLHFAACRGNASIVQLLIENGACVNATDCNGSTPLHLACCTSNVDVITALLKAGTDVEALDDRGVSPLRLAHSRLRIARSKEDEDGMPLTRKMEMYRIVEMLKEFLKATHSCREETEELEELASKLSLSETPQQVDAVQDLLEGFTTLTIQKRELVKGRVSSSQEKETDQNWAIQVIITIFSNHLPALFYTVYCIIPENHH